MSEVQHVVVMGVAGCGKSSIALAIAEHLEWPFAEADALHPQANIDKMSAGIPLTDDDRWPWLGIIREWMSEQARAGRSTVVTCSALRVAYRDVLREAEGRVRFVHLAGTRELIGSRMAAREGHFMPTQLLDSQFATLEPLTETEDGCTVDVALTPPEIVAEAIARLGLSR
ncbi:gluconokinase [Micrococcales bacterium 31B]|nr:gluconokinase [Micrococcales bacterium 31B]